MKRSCRTVKPNRKYLGKDGTSPEGPKRKCERSGCTASAPICFARVSERCTGNGWTSRWYHLTLGEHYCNECFEHFYRSYKDGYEEYDKWKRQWSAKARTEASIAPFMVEEILPYWAQCRAQGCGKWRQLSRDLDLTPEFVDTFVCGKTSANGQAKKERPDSCSIPEDERVHYVHSPLWLIQNKCTPFLKKSPAALFLSNYYADGVGLSPTEKPVEMSKEEKKKLCPFVVPFPKGDHHLPAFGVEPDMMTNEEIDTFPLIAQECPYLYLTIRNLVLALWILNPKEWVTKEKCMRRIICRGLARVNCIETLPEILAFLTAHNFINQGLVAPPAALRCHTQESVIVIGAGASGLAAAYILHSHGVKVTVLEARNQIGGRINNVTGHDVVTHASSQLLNGCANNPIALIAYQAGIDIEEQQMSCQLVDQQGSLVDDKLARRVEFHCKAILDIVSEWCKDKRPTQDAPLNCKFKEFHEEFVRETQGYFSHEEEQMMEFYLRNLEHSCGCSLSQLSSLQWEQKEEMPQFGGNQAVIRQGFSSILSKLADGLNVRFNCQVTDVSYNESGVSIKTNSGSFTIDKVIVTVPLSVLQKQTIHFWPPLPEAKQKAIKSLGCGQQEEVILQFSENFWSEKVKGQRSFGQVSATEEQQKLFSTFYPGPSNLEDLHTLSTYLVGHGLSQMEGKSDDDIVECCLTTIRSIFPEKVISAPVWSQVTHWSSDPHLGMAYSYIPVGADGSDYDHLATDVIERVYFAGEATNRQFPQTVTGAYLSGVREARKIIGSFS